MTPEQIAADEARHKEILETVAIAKELPRKSVKRKIVERERGKP